MRRTPAITSLVVDVRANGGGGDDNDMLAFSYLAQRPFHEHRAATVCFGKAPSRRYLTVDQDTTERAAIVADVARTLGQEFAPGPDGRWHSTERGNPLFQPQTNRFRGQVYLLSGPRVASAGSLFAAMVRGNTPALLIGEETMGGYYGHTGHGTLTYTLPYTGIQVSFAWVDLVQDVPQRPGQPQPLYQAVKNALGLSFGRVGRSVRPGWRPGRWRACACSRVAFYAGRCPTLLLVPAQLDVGPALRGRGFAGFIAR